MAAEALGVAALQLHYAPSLLSLSDSLLLPFGLFLSVSGGEFLLLFPESEGKKVTTMTAILLHSKPQTTNPPA